jgi:hypothetical protein
MTRHRRGQEPVVSTAPEAAYSFSARDQRRRLSTDVMTSMRFMALWLTPGIVTASYGKRSFGRWSSSGAYVEFGFPIVNRRLRNRVFARQVSSFRTGLLLPQNPDDLLFREPFLLHRVRPAMGRTLIAFGGIFQGQVS